MEWERRPGRDAGVGIDGEGGNEMIVVHEARTSFPVNDRENGSLIANHIDDACRVCGIVID